MTVYIVYDWVHVSMRLPEYEYLAHSTYKLPTVLHDIMFQYIDLTITGPQPSSITRGYPDFSLFIPLTCLVYKWFLFSLLGLILQSVSQQKSDTGLVYPLSSIHVHCRYTNSNLRCTVQQFNLFDLNLCTYWFYCVHRGQSNHFI